MSHSTTNVTEVEPRFISVKNTARYLGLSERQVYNLFYDGQLGPDVTSGRKRLLVFDAVKKYAHRIETGT